MLLVEVVFGAVDETFFLDIVGAKFISKLLFELSLEGYSS